MIARPLLAWYKQLGRQELPWRKGITPYRVWLSEIMLQQTQVATVIPYYERFLAHYPSLAALATASEEDVLTLWAGLGYYSRARNLHRTAQCVHNEYHGEFPQSLEALMALPGIGRSTAGAICAIALDLRAPILDGNVKRVLARVFAIPGWPESPKVNNQLWQLAEQETPAQQFADYTQAIMDLGATLCSRNVPDCEPCPLKRCCRAYAENRQSELPSKKPKKQIPTQETLMLLCEHNESLLFEKRPSPGIWGGLWSFPELGTATGMAEHCRRQYQLELQDSRVLQPFRHTFSHYHLQITPVHLTVAPRKAKHHAQRQWLSIHQALTAAIPAPVKKILRQLQPS